METVTSRQNPRFKEIKKLTEDKKYREEAGSFFVDGVNFVAQAVENDWEVELLVYVPEKIDSDFKKKILSLVSEDKRFAVSIDLYEALATKKDIQGIGAVVKMKLTRNEVLDGTGVVLENIANPGNLGSIARLCGAFGIKNLYVIRPAVEFFNPETVRASMGAIFQLNLVSFDSLEMVTKALAKKPRACLGTSLQGDSIDISQLTITKENKDGELIWFGSEAKGLSGEAKNLCHTLVKIPISETVDSLNVAESAAIVIYELVAKK